MPAIPMIVKDRAMTVDQWTVALKERERMCRRHASLLAEDARRIGEGLRVVRKKLKKLGHGRWTPWLQNNFKWSEQQARFFMRVAEQWPTIVQHGLDKAKRLEDLRRFVSVATQQDPKPQPKPAPGEPSPPDPDPQLTPPRPRTAPIIFQDDESLETFEGWVTTLVSIFGLSNPSDAIIQAVRECWEKHQGA